MVPFYTQLNFITIKLTTLILCKPYIPNSKDYTSFSLISHNLLYWILFLSLNLWNVLTAINKLSESNKFLLLNKNFCKTNQNTIASFNSSIQLKFSKIHKSTTVMTPTCQHPISFNNHPSIFCLTNLKCISDTVLFHLKILQRALLTDKDFWYPVYI